ncbi:hypothetical protein [Halosegnis longus]|uniref:hypothetical protein n=1 Tax=Halosegnis longus TaxID=2216012 RepID=UPI001181676F|nr:MULTISPECIES: hypothetical protein [Halobacteriales]
MNNVASRRQRSKERQWISSHAHVDGVTRGTILEYEDAEWCLVTEVDPECEPTRIGFVVIDRLGDGLVRELETAWGCWEHYLAVQEHRDGPHELWTDASRIGDDGAFDVLGPVHPSVRDRDHDRTTGEVSV